jgi:hypothetical protein
VTVSDLDRRTNAREHRLAVDEYCAGPAFTLSTADLEADDPQFITQYVRQQVSWSNLDRRWCPIQIEGDLWHTTLLALL